MQTFDITESVEEIVEVLKFKAQNMNISVNTEFLNFEKTNLLPDPDQINTLVDLKNNYATEVTHKEMMVTTDQQRMQ